MISEEKQRWVLDLLAVPEGDLDKLSQRAIARLAGIGRNSLVAIKDRGTVRTVSIKVADTAPEVERCLVCGEMALADLPCRTCRQQRRGISPVALASRESQDGGLRLEPEDQRRYERHQAWIAQQLRAGHSRFGCGLPPDDWKP